ncbi:hypothetical protein [Pseudoalteromonas sp.]|uniref:hypothetical protein n=1 Tax=Pseudoalteromonas sp. TaxID=53249 RepID=UPI0026345408|nr:hypothetical protein [Pseudoalteromonas sp.]MCP4585319.1 hypothetical protein [Pseudoalteromonas sp.]
MYIFEQLGNNGDYEKLAAVTATGFTASKLTNAAGFKCRAVQIKPEDYPVRVRMDGTDPTAAEGIQIDNGEMYTIVGTTNIANFACIDTAAGASSIKVLYFF